MATDQVTNSLSKAFSIFFFCVRIPPSDRTDRKVYTRSLSDSRVTLTESFHSIAGRRLLVSLPKQNLSRVHSVPNLDHSA